MLVARFASDLARPLALIIRFPLPLLDETDTEVRLLLFLRGALSPAAAARAQKGKRASTLAIGGGVGSPRDWRGGLLAPCVRFLQV